MILRHRGTAERQPDPDLLKDNCQAIVAWPPAWDRRMNLSPACRGAYRELFEKDFPDDMPIITDSVIDPLHKQEEQTSIPSRLRPGAEG